MRPLRRSLPITLALLVAGVGCTALVPGDVPRGPDGGAAADAATGDGGGVGPDAGVAPDSGADGGGTPCVGDGDCDDGAFCNGVERCDPGATDADARGCAPATADPCPGFANCDEGADACTDDCDVDEDGHQAVSCGGDDCDDSEALVNVDATERCDDVDHDCDGSVDEGPASHEDCVARAGLTATGATCLAGGSCRITSCAGGFEDCNGDFDDGCEADLSSAATCGSCTTSCGWFCADPDLGTCDEPVALDAGGERTCAVLSEGGLACWGAEGGADTGASPGGSARPARVEESATALLGDVRQVAVAQDGQHTCARIDESVWCWGDNEYHQLGTGDVTDHYYPQLITTLGPASDVSAGAGFTCAVTSDGRVYCWGRNHLRQAGGPDGADVLVPTAVPDIGEGETFGRAVDVEAGRDHACARVGVEEVVCWGGNDEGQAGADPGTPFVGTPQRVSGASAMTALALGARVSCGMTASGALCWGSDAAGQRGDSAMLGPSTHVPQPVSFATASEARALAVGAAHACIERRLDRGAAETACWGLNGAGQVGTTVMPNEPLPVALTALVTGSDAPSLAAGGMHSCHLTPSTSTSSAVVHCWGSNAVGQLGDGGIGGSRSDPTGAVTAPAP